MTRQWCLAVFIVTLLACAGPLSRSSVLAAGPSAKSAPAAENKAEVLKQTRPTETPSAKPSKEEVGGEGRRIQFGQGDAQFPVVVVRGTPYEMGWHLGNLMRDEMQRFVPAAIGGLQRMAGVSDQMLQDTWARTSAYGDDRFEQELVGLADGSGVPLSTLQAVHSLPILMPYSCSSVAAWGKATEDGHLYQTRDLDWKLALRAHDFPVVIVFVPKQGIPHVVPSFAGMIGAHTGMNFRGIALSEMGDAPPREAPYNINVPHFTVFFRTLLYDADSLTKALDIFQSLPHTKRYHYVFGDGQTDNRAVKIRAHMPEPPDRRMMIWKDNDPTDEFAPKVLEDVVYNDEGRGAFPLLQRDYGKLNGQKIIEIASHIATHGGNVVNVVYDTTALRLWISYAKGGQEAYLRPYTLVDLKKLNLGEMK